MGAGAGKQVGKEDGAGGRQALSTENKDANVNITEIGKTNSPARRPMRHTSQNQVWTLLRKDGDTPTPVRRFLNSESYPVEEEKIMKK